MRNDRIVRSKQVVITIFVVAALLAWWISRDEDKPLFQTDQSLRHDPDYFFENFETTVMGTDGTPRYRLFADKMFHYPDTDTATLDKPKIIVYMDDATFWHVRAQQALVRQQEGIVQLQGRVVMQRKVSDRLSENIADVEIITSDMAVYTEKEYMETERAVTINHQTGLTKAVGLRADLAQRRLFLLSQVRGQYDPPQN